jgi:putative hydrolase of the HAD superfamily
LQRTGKPAIFFDGDNTLWNVEQLYDNSRIRFCKLMKLHGFDPQLAFEVQQLIDLVNFKKLGYLRSRFPLSFVQTYEVLCRRAKVSRRRSITREVKKIGEEVFRQTPKVVHRAKTVLSTLRKEMSLVLVSAGDPLIQRRRIRQTGLARYFIDTQIVMTKTPDVLVDLVRRYGFNSKDTWMVGDSIRSDMNPALDAGLKAVLIPKPNWRAEHDSPKNGEIYLLTELAQLPSFFRTSDKTPYTIQISRRC